MRVFQLTTGADTAGINVAIKSAFARHAPEWRMDSMVAGLNYIRYPRDVTWNRMVLQRLYDAADLVHIHNTTHAHDWYDKAQGKPTVLHHHGMHSRGDFGQMVADGTDIGAVQVGSTLDLCLREPALTWLPAPVDLVEMRRIRRQGYRPSRLVRIGHAPTNRSIKGTEAFLVAMETLRAEGLPVELVLIEKLPWADCLALKATCDLFWDQPVLGYGSNSIEAWAMNIPVVSGVAEPQIRAGMLARWGKLPFFEANEATLTDALRVLVKDPNLRAEYAARGTAHVERWHDERVTVADLQRIYAEVGPSKPGGSGKRHGASLTRLDRDAFHRAFNARRAAQRVRA